MNAKLWLTLVFVNTFSAGFNFGVAFTTASLLLFLVGMLNLSVILLLIERRKK